MQLQRMLDQFSVVKNSKIRLETLLGVAAVAAAYHFAWVYQDYLGLSLNYLDVRSLLKLPIMSLVVFPIVYYAYVRPDPLQRSHWRLKSIRFFQLQLPSRYIKERCSRCAESTTCKNYIGPNSLDHNGYWFQIWRGVFEKKFKREFEDTFTKGYTCKLLFGVCLTLLLFTCLGLLMIAGAYVYSLSDHQRFAIDSGKILFVAICAMSVLLIRIFNSPDEAHPTGCWHAWREINNSHELWMRNNDPILVDKICHAGKNKKSFRSK